MKNYQLLYRYVPLEILVQIAAALMLALHLWNTVEFRPFSTLFVLVSVSVIIRATVATAIMLVNNRDPNRERRTAYRFSLISSIITGVVWGSLPVLVTINAVSSTIPVSYFIVPLACVGMASLAGSGLFTGIYLGTLLPLFATPLVWSISRMESTNSGLWALLLFTGIALAYVAQSLSNLISRYHKLSQGNNELVAKLAASRDEALSAKRNALRANEAIRKEIRERQLAEEKIKASEQELNRILKDMADTYFRVDNKGNIVRISPSVKYLIGIGSENLIGKPFANLFGYAHEAAELIERLDSHFGLAENIELCMQHNNGNDVWVSVNAHYYKDSKGVQSGFEGIIHNVTETRIAAEALFQEKERLHVTLESIADGVLTTNINGEMEYLNPAGELMTGWKEEHAAGRPLNEVLNLVTETNGKPVTLPLVQWLKDGKRAALQEPARLLNKNGKNSSAIELNGAPIRDSNNKVIGAVLVFHDVTKLRNLAKQLAHQATHDSLTGLINRIEFDNRVELAIHSARNNEKTHALCYIDLDQFKVVNDTCGHHAGDELLKQLTSLMLENMRESDTLARLGGDEFGILLSGCPLEHATEIAEKMRVLVEDYRFVWEGDVFRVGASIGLAPITAETTDLTELLSAADSACYVAKEQGRNRVHIFQQDDKAIAEHHGKMQWMQRIQEALEQDLFELHFQPITNLEQEDNKVHGEILLRMMDTRESSDTGLIPPNAFLPAAERYHLMPKIDQWVVRNTIHTLAEKRDNNILISTCSINLSGQSLSDLTLYEYTIQLLQETGLSPGILCFEITESAVVANIEVAKEFISGLKALGCRFALDDFGSGLSSFEYLKNLPVDYVKLDGSLVRDIAKNRVNLAMVRAVNYVAHVMGMKTVAEYVEDERTIKALKEISVDYAQGYWLGRPQFFSEGYKGLSSTKQIQTVPVV